MFDLLVFTQYPKAYAPRRLVTEAKLYGLSFKLYGYKNIKSTSKLPRAKFVMLREPNISNKLYAVRDMVLKHYLSTNTHVLNSNSYLKWSVLDKKTQEMEFEKGNIPHFKSENYKSLKYPFIAKAILGSHGDHVYKINNKKELKEVLNKYGEEDLPAGRQGLIFQKFQKAGFDLRVIVINSKVVGIMKRTPRKGEFLSNFSQGGKVELFSEPSESVIQIATKTAKHFKLDYVGVDIMFGNDKKWKVLEVNRACQFKGFEKALKVNIAKTLLDILSH